MSARVFHGKYSFFKTDLVSPSPHTSLSPATKEISVDSQVMLSCSSVTIKNYAVTWQFASEVLGETNTRDLVLTERYKTEGLTLAIQSIMFTDAGVYECLVVNKGEALPGQGQVSRKMSTVVVTGKTKTWLSIFVQTGKRRRREREEFNKNKKRWVVSTCFSRNMKDNFQVQQPGLKSETFNCCGRIIRAV